MRMLILIPAVLLAACGPRVVTKETIKTVSVPVIQKCASTRPEAVSAVNTRYTAEEWAELSHKQRAEIIAAQALSRMNYASSLEAATSAC